MPAGMTLVIALLVVSLPAAAEVSFLIPVEIEAVRGAASVNVECIVSRSRMRAEVGDSVDYSAAATIRNRVAVDLPGSAAEDGWAGTVEVPLEDRMNGEIDLADGRHYVCKTTVGYRPDAGTGKGLSLLANRNCGLALQYLDTYRERMRADIAEHRLCRQAPFKAGSDLVDVGRMILRRGDPRADEPIADLNAMTTFEKRSKRIGRRYASFPLEGDLEDCARACVRDRSCRSWSGWQTFRGGRCFLSTEVPPRTEAEYSFAYSGVVGSHSGNATDAPDAPEGVAQ